MTPIERPGPGATGHGRTGGDADVRTHPASADRFDDVATMLAPKDPDGRSCWCLAYRLSWSERSDLTGRDLARRVRELCHLDPAPGILAYLEDEVVGWAGVAPRRDLHAFAREGKIPHVDDLPVWTVWCLKVRSGYRRRGVTSALLEGAVEFARAHGAPAIEGYPVDNAGARIDATLAFVGTRSMFEQAGFRKAADTDSVSARTPRIVMRRSLA